MPFFPRVLAQLVGLDRPIPQRVAIHPDQGVVLEPMPQRQELHPVALQLARQPGRGDALGEAAEDQEQLGRAALHPLQGGPGPGVEDATAGRAAMIQDRITMTAMDLEALAGMASGAAQAVGMEQVDELAVAGVLVEQVGDREVQER
jgi:hypothetical protein